jgi:tRNA(fMet)-specific endonuclease VapC
MLLLDTDVMVDVLRRYPIAISWLASLGDEEVILPGFVVMELILGCRNKTEQTLVEHSLAQYEVAWPQPEVSQQALVTFSSYHLSDGLGIIDALIGQMAVDFNLPLHTFNQKHYEVIPDLRCVQPYEKVAEA